MENPRRGLFAVYVTVAIVVSTMVGVSVITSRSPAPTFSASISPHSYISARALVSQAASYDAGLVAHFSLDSTTITDTAGTYSGSVHGSPTVVAGAVGSALSLNSSGDYIALGGDPVGSGDMSVCGWFKPTNLSGNLFNNAKFIVVFSTLGRLAVTSNNASTYPLSTSNAVTTNAWQLICITRSSSGSASIYVNGKAVLSNASSGTPEAGQSLKIGTNQFGNNGFYSGAVDEIRFYNRVVSAADISDLYASSGGTPASPSTGGAGGTGGTGGQPSTPSADTLPPTVPTGLASSNITTNGATITWNPSTDNTAVTGYAVYKNASFVTNVSQTSYTDASLAAGITYTYAVAAYDAASNASARSASISVTTAADQTQAPSVNPTPIPPPPATVHGDGSTEAGEACDGGDLNGNSASSIAPGYKGGTLRCKNDTSGYDISGLVSGATIPAASCNAADVQAAINQANSGDIVTVPAGTCVWTKRVFIGGGGQYPYKNLKLAGAGVDSTTIIDQTASDPNNFGSYALNIKVTNGVAVRVTGFTFDGVGSAVSQGLISVSGGASSYARLDHITFRNLIYRGVLYSGGVNGVIDHSTFIKGSGNATGISVIADGDSSWTRPLSLGTANAVYIEDNTFDWGTRGPSNGAIDMYNGSRYVFRYNTVIGTWIGNHGFDSGSYRSGFSYEVYNNTFTNPNASGAVYVLQSRGGTGVIYSNTVSSSGGSYNYFATLQNYRSSTSYQIAYGGLSPLGFCDGHNSSDQNLDQYGYACRDQVGRTTNQTFSPVYAWSNNFKGVTGGFASAANYGTKPAGYTAEYHDYSLNVIVPNRDYFNNQAKPGYTAYVYPHPMVQMDSSAPSNPNPPVNPEQDQIAPSVSIVEPQANQTVAGLVHLSASASDNVGVAGVQFRVDGSNLGPEVTIVPYAGSWDTTGMTNGTHTITAVARDAAGNKTTSSAVTVTISNVIKALDTTAPSVPTNIVVTPASPYQINISWSPSSDDTGVVGYKIVADGTPLISISGTAYSHTGLASQTTHTYTVSAYDAAGNISIPSAAVSATTLKRDPDTLPPLTISNGLPWQPQPAGTDRVTLAVSTNRNATCSYGTSPSSVSTQFASTGGLLHTTSITNLKNATTYTYYVTCIDPSNGETSTGNYLISFSVLGTPQATPLVRTVKPTTPTTPRGTFTPIHTVVKVPSTSAQPNTPTTRIVYHPVPLEPSVPLAKLDLNINSWAWLFDAYGIIKTILNTLVGI